MSLTKIKEDYKYIGWANSPSFKKPNGDWKRVFVSGHGNLEIYAEHDLKQYYKKDCG